MRVRCAFVREQVQNGMLEVTHVEGRRQLADLATKMHPRARLLDLLVQWSFEGLPAELVQLRALHVITVGCVMLALDRLPRAEAAYIPGDIDKQPLASAGVDELLLVSGVVAVVAVLVWELVKWLVRCLHRSAKKESKLKRLRELARLAAEVEIDRVEAEQRLPTSVEVTDTVQAAVSGAAERPERVSLTALGTEAQQPAPSAATPRASVEPQPRSSPGGQSTTSSISDDLTRHLDRERLCKDVLTLLHCDALRTGLRQEGMTVSGLKPELVARLALKLMPDPNFMVPGRALPTEKQLRYVLWIWRHGWLQTKCQLQWRDVANRENISNWIRLWKETTG